MENEEKKKKQPKEVDTSKDINLNVNFNWGVLASEMRNLIEEFKDKDDSSPIPITYNREINQESLDTLLTEVRKRMMSEMAPEKGNKYWDDPTPFTTFIKTFACSGFPTNVIVDRISFGYSLEELEAYIDGRKIEVKLENEDIKRLVDVKDDNATKHEFALKLFPKYFKDILLRESFYNYKDYEDDYSKYIVPEGVEISNVILSLNELSAVINGDLKTARLQPADYISTLCFDINGFRNPKATAEQLVVKYFLTENSEEENNVNVSAEIYADYLKNKLLELKTTIYRNTTEEWLAISNFTESLSIKDNKILGEVSDENKYGKLESIILAVKYMFSKDFNVNLSDIPDFEISICCKLDAGEQELFHRPTFRR